MLHKSQIFLVTMVAFLVGVALASYFFVPQYYIYYGLAGCCLGFIFYKKPMVFLGIVGLFFCLLGMWRYQGSLPIVSSEFVSFYNEQKATFSGAVLGEVDERVDQQKITLTADQILIDKNWRRVRGQVLIKADLFPKYNYGEYLQVECVLKTPESIEDFAYDRFLAKANIYSLCYYPQIKKISAGYGNLVTKYILQFKSILLRKINQLVHEPQASFLAGILIGARKGIPAELTQAFNRTGITHIIAISGYNITIIATILLSGCVGFGISRKKSFYVSVVVIFFFVIICGLPASVVRAGVMGLLVLLSQNLGRVARMSNILVLVAGVMILINPKILIFDAGFQLSFLATIGLVYLQPVLANKFEKLPKVWQLKETILTTTAAIIITAPLIIYQFQRFSLVALLVNMLVLPVIPFSMALGFLAVIFGFVWLPLGQGIAWLVWLVLEYVIRITLFFSQFSLSSFDLPGIPWQIMLAGYFFLIYIIFLRSAKTNVK